MSQIAAIEKKPVPDTPRRRFLDRFRPIAAKGSALFKSVHVQDFVVRSISDGCQIVHDAFKSPGLTAELQRLTGPLGGLSSPVVRQLFFRAFDRVVVFSKGYLDLLGRNDDALPREGTIVDIGATNGSVAAYLREASPSRSITSFDSAQGARIPAGAAGIVLNNSLWALAPAARLTLLKSLFSQMAGGATLIINEPVSVDQIPKERANTILGRLVANSVLSRSPMTEMDIAYFSYVAGHAFIESCDQFLSERELSDLAIAAGFQIAARKLAMHSSITFLHLRKPVGPRTAS